MRRELARQQLTFGSRLEALYALPDTKAVARTPILVALLWMIAIDCGRPLRVSLVRLQSAGLVSWLLSLFGLLPTRDAKLEQAISVARQQARLAKRILFLSRTQQVFRLWHVVHRPFSYAFAILALLHIGISLFMGYGLTIHG